MHRHLVQTVCSRSKADRILPICNTLDPVFQYQGIPSEIPDKDKEDIPWMCDEMGKAAEDNVTVVVAICPRQAVEDICCRAPVLALQI